MTDPVVKVEECLTGQFVVTVEHGIRYKPMAVHAATAKEAGAERLRRFHATEFRQEFMGDARKDRAND